jgi:hypothetical protein
VWDLIGVASYALAFALIESVVVWLLFVLFAAVLPARVFKDHFVAIGSTIAIITSLWVIDANYHLVNLGDIDLSQSLPGFIAYLISIAVPIGLILRYSRVERIIYTIVQRITVLVLVYAALACIGIVIVVIRNI